MAPFDAQWRFLALFEDLDASWSTLALYDVIWRNGTLFGALLNFLKLFEVV